MTETTTFSGQLKFKAPGSDEWSALLVDGQDKEQQQKTKTARTASRKHS